MEESVAETPSIEEQLQKAAIDLLVTQDEQYPRAVLLSCGLRFAYSHENWMIGARRIEGIDIILTGPPALYQVLRSIEGLSSRRSSGVSRTAAAIRDALRVAVEAILDDCYLDSIRINMEATPPFEGWREEYLAAIRGDRDPSNQAVVASHPPAFMWNGLRFRSRTEMVLAQALSRNGVLYFPLAAAVSGQRKLEPDFLICNPQGKCGILEVHGSDFHTTQTAAKEHERGRWFKERGIRLFEVYDAQDCYKDPGGVVERFLKLLASS